MFYRGSFSNLLSVRNFSLLFIMIFMLIIFSCQKESEPASASEGAPLIENVPSADGVVIKYQVQGTGEPALVFVHGWSCDRSYWQTQIEYFSKKYRVVTVDLAGHGESGMERKDYTFSTYGEDVSAVIRKLHLKKVILIGHSMGGVVILEAARLVPGSVIGLVGVDTLHDFEEKFTDEQREQFMKQFTANFREATDKFVRSMSPATVDPALVEKIAADMSSAPPEVAIDTLENLFKYDLLKILPEIKIPIICINSDFWPTNVEINRKHNPGFEVMLMPGTGHFVQLEDPRKFNELLDQEIHRIISSDYKKK